MFRISVLALVCAFFAVSCSDLKTPSKPVEKLEFPATDLLNDLVTDLTQARTKWVGRRIEFQFRPADYDKVGDQYRLNGQDTPFYCDVDKDTFERVELRKDAYYIIVRGTVGDINLDEPVALKDCEVVSLTDVGWKPDKAASVTSSQADAELTQADQRASRPDPPSRNEVTIPEQASEQEVSNASIEMPSALSRRPARCKVSLPGSEPIIGTCTYSAFADRQFELVMKNGSRRFKLLKRDDGYHNFAAEADGTLSDLGNATQRGACWISNGGNLCAWSI